MHLEEGEQEPREFSRTFRIGRVEECDIRISNKFVSRTHVEVSCDNGFWSVRDLNSSNGLFLMGQKTALVRLTESVTLRLGMGGPYVTFTVLSQSPPLAPVNRLIAADPLPPDETPAQEPVVPAPTSVPAQRSVSGYVDHYFGEKPEGQPIGQHTMLVRMAYSELQKKNRQQWLALVGVLMLLIVAATGFAVVEHRRARRQLALAENLFYSMRSLDVNIANFERVAIQTNNETVVRQLRESQSRRRFMEQQYDKFLSALKTDDPKLTPQSRLILRISRIFGECELAMPPTFQAEVEKYIRKWQSTGRLKRAIALAQEKGYIQTIGKELLAAGLPPQFFYLALQESDLDPFISGPETRKGIAKGMWQFIPDTAVKYGMKVGPLVKLRRPDPADDRHHWDIETRAAARYMKDLYGSDAQSSGLLIMACYNWGEDSVLPLVRSLPPNPGERNFWKLLSKYRARIPDETYDYVFSIVSAAVIGEDPKLFGFDFDNPFATLETH